MSEKYDGTTRTVSIQQLFSVWKPKTARHPATTEEEPGGDTDQGHREMQGIRAQGARNPLLPYGRRSRTNEFKRERTDPVAVNPDVIWFLLIWSLGNNEEQEEVTKWRETEWEEEGFREIDFGFNTKMSLRGEEGRRRGNGWWKSPTSFPFITSGLCW